MRLEGEKFLTVARLRALLTELPDDAMLCARSLGNTGNLGVYAPAPRTLGAAVLVAAVEFGEERIERYVEARPPARAVPVSKAELSRLDAENLRRRVPPVGGGTP